MKEPIRVLHVLGNTQLGGAESRIMDLYRHLDRDRVQFDFLVTHSRRDISMRRSKSWEGGFSVFPVSASTIFLFTRERFPAFLWNITSSVRFRDISPAVQQSIFPWQRRQAFR